MATNVKRCADVTYDMADQHCGESHCDSDVGDLLWNPKMGDGHILVAEAPCGSQYNGKRVDCCCGGWIPACSSPSCICECGEDNSWRDHHYEILAKPA